MYFVLWSLRYNDVGDVLGFGLDFWNEFSEFFLFFDDNGRDVVGVGDGFFKDIWFFKGFLVILFLLLICFGSIFGVVFLIRWIGLFCWSLVVFVLLKKLYSE